MDKWGCENCQLTCGTVYGKIGSNYSGVEIERSFHSVKINSWIFGAHILSLRRNPSKSARINTPPPNGARHSPAHPTIEPIPFATDNLLRSPSSSSSSSLRLLLDSLYRDCPNCSTVLRYPQTKQATVERWVEIANCSFMEWPNHSAFFRTRLVPVELSHRQRSQTNGSRRMTKADGDRVYPAACVV